MCEIGLPHGNLQAQTIWFVVGTAVGAKQDTPSEARCWRSYRRRGGPEKLSGFKTNNGDMGTPWRCPYLIRRADIYAKKDLTREKCIDIVRSLSVTTLS